MRHFHSFLVPALMVVIPISFAPSGFGYLEPDAVRSAVPWTWTVRGAAGEDLMNDQDLPGVKAGGAYLTGQTPTAANSADGNWVHIDNALYNTVDWEFREKNAWTNANGRAFALFMVFQVGQNMFINGGLGTTTVFTFAEIRINGIQIKIMADYNDSTGLVDFRAIDLRNLNKQLGEVWSEPVDTWIQFWFNYTGTGGSPVNRVNLWMVNSDITTKRIDNALVNSGDIGIGFAFGDESISANNVTDLMIDEVYFRNTYAIEPSAPVVDWMLY